MAPETATLLWKLRGHGRDVRCVRQRTPAGLELRVLWGEELFLTEMFRDPDRLMKRSEEFKATLQTRGWAPIPIEEGTAGVSPAMEPTEPAPRERLVEPAERPSRAAGHQRVVLVVDDEPGVRAFLRRYLGEAGYAVTEAQDVDTALNALDRDPVDAVVLDVRLPDPMGWGRTGLEVLAFIRLHNAYSGLPVLVLTGHPLEPEEQDLIRRHRADVFMKPDGYGLLLRRLEGLTRGSRLEQ
jgi:CheY-like chemotaxis protein